jgi:hypothetical protein
MGNLFVAIDSGGLYHWISIPIQSQPIQNFQDGSGIFFCRAQFIGIFDAKKKLPAVMSSE